MDPYSLSKELNYVAQKSVGAVGYVPRNSFYRTWLYQMIAGELPAAKYPKLKDKLRRFYGAEWTLSDNA